MGRDELRAELAAMTVKQVRRYARDHGISLGYASRKADMIAEIVVWVEHRRKERER